MTFNKHRWLKVPAKTVTAVGKAAVGACWVNRKDYCGEDGDVDYAEIGKIFADHDHVFAETHGCIYFVPIWQFVNFKKKFPNCSLGDSEFGYLVERWFDGCTNSYIYCTTIYDASRNIPSYNGPYNPCVVCSDSSAEYMSAEMLALISALNAVDIEEEEDE